eukprot:5556964-Pleurochrysis_carterae.AAC.3
MHMQTRTRPSAGGNGRIPTRAVLPRTHLHASHARVLFKLNDILDRSACGNFFVQAREVFRAIDTNGDGSLSERELRVALAKLNLDGSREAARSVLAAYDVDGDRRISMREFVPLVAELRRVLAHQASQPSQPRQPRPPVAAKPRVDAEVCAARRARIERALRPLMKH